MYEFGRSVAQSDAEAMNWYKKAAEQDYAESQAQLGIMYEHLQGENPNYVEAYFWESLGVRGAFKNPDVYNLPRMAAAHLTPDQRKAVDERVQAWLKAHPAQTYADPLQGGIAAYDRKDYETALKLWQPLAEQGNAAAQTRLGNLYYKGEGVTQSVAEALRWWRKAADQSEPIAENNVGNFYQNGIGVPRDPAEAMNWYLLAAKHGSVRAMANIGWLYQHGVGGAVNDAEAVKWSKMAAEKGDVQGQRQLGWIYTYRSPVNYPEAMKWSLKAAAQGDVSSQSNVGWLYLQGLGVPKDYAEAAKWYRLSANQGYANGQCQLAWLYLTGNGIPKDTSQARDLYQKGAAQGDSTCETMLGWMSYNVPPVDYNEAMKWSLKAANQGAPVAQNNIGCLYENGYGVTQDYRQAMTWYQKGMKGGYIHTLFNIGHLYAEGLGVQKNASRARMLMVIAASLGDQDALDWLIMDNWKMIVFLL